MTLDGELERPDVKELFFPNLVSTLRFCEAFEFKDMNILQLSDDVWQLRFLSKGD